MYERGDVVQDRELRPADRQGGGGPLEQSVAVDPEPVWAEDEGSVQVYFPPGRRDERGVLAEPIVKPGAQLGQETAGPVSLEHLDRRPPGARRHQDVHIAE